MGLIKTKGYEKMATKKTTTNKKPSTSKTKKADTIAAVRLPEPPPEQLTVDIFQMPAVPALRHALISWGTGSGHQADLEIARLARELSEKHCHFCGAESDPSMAVEKPWREVKLCACLEPASVGVAKYTDRMRDLFGGGPRPAALPAPTPAMPVATAPAPMNAMDAFAAKYGSVRLTAPSHYQEFFPDWRNRIPEIQGLVQQRILPLDETLYANRCACGADFGVTAGMLVRSVQRHGQHSEMRKCAKCRADVIHALGQRQEHADDTGHETPGQVPTPAAAEAPRMAKPKRRRSGKSDELRVSLGDIAAAHEEVAS